MGNCVTNSRVISQEQLDDSVAPIREGPERAEADLKQQEGQQGCDKKKCREKKVRFKLNDNEDDDRGHGYVDSGDKNGVVRVKVVVTKEELRQILKYSNTKGSDQPQHSSLEQLMSALRTRSGRSNIDGNWRPGLESIPENR